MHYNVGKSRDTTTNGELRKFVLFVRVSRLDSISWGTNKETSDFIAHNQTPASLAWARDHVGLMMRSQEDTSRTTNWQRNARRE